MRGLACNGGVGGVGGGDGGKGEGGEVASCVTSHYRHFNRFRIRQDADHTRCPFCDLAHHGATPRPLPDHSPRPPPMNPPPTPEILGVHRNADGAEMAGVTGDVAEPQQAGVGKLGQCLRLTISGNPAVRRVKPGLRCRGYAVRSGRGGRGRHGGVRHRLPGGCRSLNSSVATISSVSPGGPPPAGARSSPAKGRPQPRRWPICSPGPRQLPAFSPPAVRAAAWAASPMVRDNAPARRDPSASSTSLRPGRSNRADAQAILQRLHLGADRVRLRQPQLGGQPTTGIPRSRSRERRETGSSQALSCIHV